MKKNILKKTVKNLEERIKEREVESIFSIVSSGLTFSLIYPLSTDLYFSACSGIVAGIITYIPLYVYNKNNGLDFEESYSFKNNYFNDK